VVLITKTKAGLPLAVESWTLERFAEHWLKHVVGPRLHLRHSERVPAPVGDGILEHSQLAITTDLYSHVMPTALRAAADAMDRVLVQRN
jgi:integrase